MWEKSLLACLLEYHRSVRLLVFGYQYRYTEQTRLNRIGCWLMVDGWWSTNNNSSSSSINDDHHDDISSAMIVPAIPMKSTRLMNMRIRMTRWSSWSSWSSWWWPRPSLILSGYSYLILVIFLNCSKSEIIPQPSSSSLSPISIPFGLPSISSTTLPPSSSSEAPEVGANCSKWNPFNLWSKNGNRNRHNKRSLMFTKRKRLKNNNNKNNNKNMKNNNGQKSNKWPMFYNNDTRPMVTSGQYNHHHNPNHHHQWQQHDHGHGHHDHDHHHVHPNKFSSYYHHQQQQQQQVDDLNQNQGLILHPQALAATAAAAAAGLPFHQPQPPPNPFLFALPHQASSASSAQGSVEFPDPDPSQQFFMVGGSGPGSGTMAQGQPMANLYAYHAHHHQPHVPVPNPSVLYPTVFDFEDYHHLHQYDGHHQHDYHHHHKDHLPRDYDPMQWDGTNDSEEQLDHRHHHHQKHHRGQQQQQHHHRKPNYNKQNHLNHQHHNHAHHGHHDHNHDHHHYSRDHDQDNYQPKNEKYQGPRYRRPVAKDLISDKQNDSYYEPFPVDPIRGYYMGGSLSSSSSTYEEEDDEDNGDGGEGGDGQYNGHDDHDDHHHGGGYSGQDSGQDYNEIKNNHNHNHNHNYKKCYRRKQWNQNDLEWALKQAHGKMKWYSKIIQKNAMDTRRRTPYIPNGVLDAKIWEYATFYLKQRMCLTKMDVVKLMPKIDGKKIQQYQYEMYACRQESYIICEPKARYRSIDGACNNLKKKTWSKSFTCHRRLLPPDYADGVAEPRQSSSSSSSSSSYYGVGKLPNARDLSSLLLPDVDVPDHRLTSMAMAFGQFIIHDVARTLPTANDIRCCPVKQANIHPECFAIEIKRPDDVLRKYYNQTCMNFVRSVVCNPCGLGPREQQNQATHTFDMSQMYGLRLNDSLQLRTYRGGKLRGSWTSTSPKEELPPKMTREEPGCNIRPKPPRFKCFETADGIRASQHPALQSMHTVFHRRHNQHTDGLAKVNPHWSDEKLYQEARHITIAEVSNMIYGQYLSAVFGEKLMKHFRLSVKKQGYTKYNHQLNPSTLQEFIVAGGRFGHSQINKRFRVVFNDPKLSYSYRLRDNFFETTIVSLGHSGGVLKGLSLDSTQASDPYFVDDVKNSLYHLRKERLGRDLPAFNIQRGREHGIPGYVYYLDFCFGFKVYKWNDLATFIPGKHLKKIRLFYRHWNDIDLFVGGVFERLMDGAAFGPTFGCINGIQFYNFKYGDRFYFEHGYQSGSFNPEQLDNIRKVSTLSSIICKTHPEMDQMPSNAFVRTSPMDNPMVPCFKFPELDYKLWVDTRYKKQKQQQYRKKTKPDEDDPPKSNYGGGSGGKMHPQPSNAISDHHHNGGHRDDNDGEEDDDDDDGGGARTTVRPYGDHHKYGYSDKYHYQYRSDEYPEEYNQTDPPDKKQQEEDNYWDFGYNKQVILR